MALGQADFGDIRGAIFDPSRAVSRGSSCRASPCCTCTIASACERAAKADFGSGALLCVDDVLGTRGVVETFESLRSQGVVEFFGCSAYGGDMAPSREVVDSGAFDCIQVHYSC